MPKIAKELSAYQVRRLKRPGLHAVGGVNGLYLNVRATAGRSWILRVRVAGRTRELGLGSYPTVPLDEARAEARRVRGLVRQGVDPVAARREAEDRLRAAEAKRLSFDEAVTECWSAKATEFRNRKHAMQWKSSLDQHASPLIGAVPVDQIDQAHIRKVLEPIWATKTETATRVRQRIETVLNWATVGGHREGENPARWKGNLEHVLAKPRKVRRRRHHPALPRQQLGKFVHDLRARPGVSARALEFAILTAARSGEVRHATWDEFDLEANIWTIPGERMKAGKPHRVPLSAPALAIIKAQPRRGDSPYVFTSARGRPLSDMALSQVCRRMEVDAVPHGFRSTFKDWARSSTAYADEISELALAHVGTDATRAAYARDELLPQRTRLMRDWAKFCNVVDTKAEATVTGIGAASSS